MAQSAFNSQEELKPWNESMKLESFTFLQFIYGGTGGDTQAARR